MNRSTSSESSAKSGEDPTRDSATHADRRHDRIVIGSHLILHGYGHWLPNDPRGSGSDELRREVLSDLGPFHQGRRKVQPSRSDLKEFYRKAEPRLDFPTLWFNDAMRQAIGEAFSRIVRSHRYTVWTCAILSNHAHLCIRRHRDEPASIWRAFAEESAEAVRRFADVPADHPVWSNRPYKVFLKAPEDVRRVVAYVKQNPVKENLPRQRWSFVTPYDGWPQARRE